MLSDNIADSYWFDNDLRFDKVYEMKQKKHQKRIAVRLPSEQRQQIEKFVDSGRFRNLSEVIRVALKQFFEREGID